ncbi:shikimate dehydrogenase family protein [Histidinibacterium aquaticum]|uniref:shikimate dehydrogenase family protein n=1 Tax=Histidinibacterium aquaticum TaxID=2613962 RepID=UPI00168C0308|nr:shikimate dehydrogenase [Histidinibacterium aquaticum]
MAQRLYGIIGYPIGQARSPEVFNDLLRQAGEDAVMMPLEVAPERFEDCLDGLRAIANFAGLVVTVPHKLAAARIASRRSKRVERVGAANLLRPVAEGWEADLSDGIGFVAGLRASGHSVEGQFVSVVGAGGAGVAISEALLSAGARVSITDIDGKKASEAARRLSSVGHIEVRKPSLEHSLVVNATPVGMAGDPQLPLNLDDLGPAALVAEAIMKPPVTPLLKEAARRGHSIHEGSHMLDGQVPAIWDFLGMSCQPAVQEVK